MVGNAAKVTELSPELRVAVERVLSDTVAEVTVLDGATTSVNRVTGRTGRSLVVKHGTGPGPDFYACEAAGLRAIGAAGVRVPEVWDVTEDWLLMEDIRHRHSETMDWEAVGRTLATIHGVRSDRFGFATDNYNGVMPQRNGWDEDGLRFYVEKRLLAQLESPLVQRVLGPDGLRDVELLAARIPDLLPSQPAVLNHGDFWLVEGGGSWHGNVLFEDGLTPVIIDPAASYCWAECDLSMFLIFGPELPPAFLAAYREVNPLLDGLEDRLPILMVHDHLQVVEHADDWPEFRARSVAAIRETVARYT